MEVNPLNIFFVKSDSKGDRLLFRYPYTTPIKYENKQEKSGRRNPYALNTNEDLLQNPQAQTSNLWQGQLSGFTDEMLSTLFAVKAELCNRKFELKVNDVRFVGHPTLLPYRTSKDDNAAMILINIVFALQASASHSIVKCYYDLSKRLGKALRHEEKRCSYLTEEMKIMLAAHDEVSVLDGDSTPGENDEDEDNLRHSVSSTTFSIDNTPDSGPKSAFHLILQRSSLARSMRAVFEQLSNKGIVQVRINNWVLLSFCLPHKAHQIYNRGLIIEPETIDRCLQKLRPYHGILLMIDPNELLESIPLDGSPALLRLIKLYSPLKSLQTLAIEADLKLLQVFQLTGHLVYWAKATVIYPLCEGNVYVVAPGANIHVNSPLVDDFAREFQGLCLLTVLSEFSLPAPLWYHARGGAGGGADVTRLPVIVAWLLRRRLLLQLHTYVQFNGSNWGKDNEGRDYFCEKHNNIYNPAQPAHGSISYTPLNIPEPVEQRNSVATFLDSDEDYPTENNLNQTDFSHTQPIIIESELLKQTKNEEGDSVNHSFEDSGIDIDEVLESIKQNELQANSVDSGISSNLNGTNKIVNDVLESETIKDFKHIPLSENKENKDCSNNNNVKRPKINTKTVTLKIVKESLKDSSDDDKFDSDSDGSSSKPRALNGQPSIYSKAARGGITLKLKLHTETSFQAPTMWSGNGSCDVVDACRPPVEQPSEEALLDTFSEKERKVLADIPASRDSDDLLLLAQLHKKGYLNGDKHLEVIMFMENLSRSQLMQLLDKFKDVLITFETEDPAVAMLYPYQ